MNRMNSMTSDNLPVSKAPKQVQNWQKSLLDLSLRNPLINRTSRHAVELRVPPALIGEFEDLVNDKENTSPSLRGDTGPRSRPTTVFSRSRSERNHS